MSYLDPGLEAPQDDEARRAAAEAANDDDQAEIEEKARRAGWKPQDEYRGPPDKWKPAAEFLEGLEEYAVLRERYDTLDQRTAAMERDLKGQITDLSAKLAEAGQVIQDVHTQNQKIREGAYKRARKDIEREMRAATESADTDAFDAAKEKLDALDEEQAELAAPPAREPDDDKKKQQETPPEVIAWRDKNPWFAANKPMRDFAIARHGELLAEKPGMTLAENLEEVTAEVRRRFPEKFGNPRRDDPAAVGSPGSPPTKPKPRSYDALPKDAKAECDRFIRQFNANNPKTPMTREKWVEQYDWDAD